MSGPAIGAATAANSAFEVSGLAMPRRGAAIFAVLSAMALVVLDAGIVNIALPTISRTLALAPGRAVLVMTAYQAGLMIALLPCGALGARFGYRRVFTAGVATFAGASALCAVSPGLEWLVAARFVQGLGGAAVMALGVALLRFSVPSARLGAAVGWNALTVALASAAAPSLGAAILASADWPWLFAASLPWAAVSLALARSLPAGARDPAPLDLISMALSSVTVALFILAAELARGAALAAAILLGGGALCLAALIRREAPKTAPMIPLDLLREPAFRLSTIASVCLFAGQAAGLVALPFLLQQGLGQTIRTTGLYLTAWPLSVMLAAAVSGRLSERVSTDRLCILGAVTLAAGFAGAAAWPLQGDARPILPFIVLCGLGFGLFQTPNNRNLFLSAPAARSGAAGGLQGTARVTGQTLGALGMTALFGAVSAQVAPRLGLGLAAGLALTAGLVSLARARR